jgi:predicted TIM-barrel fold metal-dependent hydrolase
VIIDPHNHVLGNAVPPGHELFKRHMLRHLAPDELPTSGHSDGEVPPWLAPVDPERLIAEHREAGVDLSVVLALAPSDYTEYGERGTVDIAGVTGIEPRLSIDKSNDYIAALARRHDELLGFAGVNPLYRGVDAARTELRRAIRDLGLRGLKLYPLYDRYPVAGEAVRPIFAEAAALGIPVMMHMGTSPARDTVLEYGRPLGVDEVAREFRELPLMICHAGVPWVDDALTVAARHPNVYVELSYFQQHLSQRELYEFLLRARRLGVAWSQLVWATDYPGAGRVSVLLAKFALVNDARQGGPPISAAEMAGMLGGNWARFARFDGWDEERAIARIAELEDRWREVDIR